MRPLLVLRALAAPVARTLAAPVARTLAVGLVLAASACAKRPLGDSSRATPPADVSSPPSSSPPPSPAPPDASPPPPAAPDAGPASAPSLTPEQRAEACLTEPTCAAAEAARLFVAADDAHDDTVDCLRFADGDGTPKDLARARACLARSVAQLQCGGSSAGLWQAELAIDLIDGVGGPQDISGARRIFDGCFADVTQQEVLAHADARAADAGTPRIDFCKDYGGTTLTGNECSARARRHEETKGALQAKSAVAGLDDEGKSLFAAASAAYAGYVGAMGAYVYECFKEGTIRNAAALAEETELLARRTADVAKFAKFVAGATSPAEIERASRKVDAALKKRSAAAATAEIRQTVVDGQAAWAKYREAEVALYEHAFGGDAGVDAVRGAVGVRLDRERALDLAK